VFHFFLFCLLNTVKEIDQFMYRIYRGDVIKIDDFPASYTVINGDENLNYTRFTMTDQLDLFIERSLAAKRHAEASCALINTGEGDSEREQRNNIFITCLPWLELAAIEHPVHRHRDADIPTFTWASSVPRRTMAACASRFPRRPTMASSTATTCRSWRRRCRGASPPSLPRPTGSAGRLARARRRRP
jgi:hypothetical protein